MSRWEQRTREAMQDPEVKAGAEEAKRELAFLELMATSFVYSAPTTGIEDTVHVGYDYFHAPLYTNPEPRYAVAGIGGVTVPACA